MLRRSLLCKDILLDVLPVIEWAASCVRFRSETAVAECIDHWATILYDV